MKEEFTEPKHPGISYSFSADGYYEEAYYRAVANRTFSIRDLLHQSDHGPNRFCDGTRLTVCVAQNPKCPQGIIQWQHGKFSKLTNGSLVLEPIKVDGRQVYSDPCSFKNSIYTRYNTSELFEVRNLHPQYLHEFFR